jgi:hypothetical protein
VKFAISPAVFAWREASNTFAKPANANSHGKVFKFFIIQFVKTEITSHQQFK